MCIRDRIKGTQGKESRCLLYLWSVYQRSGKIRRILQQRLYWLRHYYQFKLPSGRASDPSMVHRSRHEQIHGCHHQFLKPRRIHQRFSVSDWEDSETASEISGKRMRPYRNPGVALTRFDKMVLQNHLARWFCGTIFHCLNQTKECSQIASLVSHDPVGIQVSGICLLYTSRCV